MPSFLPSATSASDNQCPHIVCIWFWYPMISSAVLAYCSEASHPKVQVNKQIAKPILFPSELHRCWSWLSLTVWPSTSVAPTLLTLAVSCLPLHNWNRSAWSSSWSSTHSFLFCLLLYLEHLLVTLIVEYWNHHHPDIVNQNFYSIKIWLVKLWTILTDDLTNFIASDFIVSLVSFSCDFGKGSIILLVPPAITCLNFRQVTCLSIIFNRHFHWHFLCWCCHWCFWWRFHPDTPE